MIRLMSPEDILEFPETGEAYFRQDYEALGDAAPFGEPTVYQPGHPLYEQRARDLMSQRTGAPQ